MRKQAERGYYIFLRRILHERDGLNIEQPTKSVRRTESAQQRLFGRREASVPVAWAVCPHQVLDLSYKVIDPHSVQDNGADVDRSGADIPTQKRTQHPHTERRRDLTGTGANKCVSRMGGVTSFHAPACMSQRTLFAVQGYRKFLVCLRQKGPGREHKHKNE